MIYYWYLVKKIIIQMLDCNLFEGKIVIYKNATPEITFTAFTQRGNINYNFKNKKL